MRVPARVDAVDSEHARSPDTQGGSAPAPSLRRRLHRHLDPAAWGRKGLSPLNRLVVVAICAAVLLVVLESESEIRELSPAAFAYAEIVFSILFLAEFAARVWVVPERLGYGEGWRERLRYLRSWPAMLDMVALLPSLLVTLGSESFILRLFRLLRILRLGHLGRLSVAISAIVGAVVARRFELLTSLLVALVLVLVSATLLHICEGAGQPATFGSIPRAMWWAVVTLTTVGYGDVYPATPLGKLFAGLTALTGIGLIAMPTGILAAAFSDAIQKQRAAERDE